MKREEVKINNIAKLTFSLIILNAALTNVTPTSSGNDEQHPNKLSHRFMLSTRSRKRIIKQRIHIYY